MPDAESSRATHWRVSYGSTGHCWLTLDKAGTSSNTLSREVLDELDEIISGLALDSDLPGVVIRSAKRSGFILGADVREFEQLTDPDVAAELAAKGQAVLKKLLGDRGTSLDILVRRVNRRGILTP